MLLANFYVEVWFYALVYSENRLKNLHGFFVHLNYNGTLGQMVSASSGLMNKFCKLSLARKYLVVNHEAFNMP